MLLVKEEPSEERDALRTASNPLPEPGSYIVGIRPPPTGAGHPCRFGEKLLYQNHPDVHKLVLSIQLRFSPPPPYMREIGTMWQIGVLA